MHVKLGYSAFSFKGTRHRFKSGNRSQTHLSESGLAIPNLGMDRERLYQVYGLVIAEYEKGVLCGRLFRRLSSWIELAIQRKR